MVTAVQTSGVNTGVSRRLHVARLQATIPEHALTVGPGTCQQWSNLVDCSPRPVKVIARSSTSLLNTETTSNEVS
jgi:hypothetical protein